MAKENNFAIELVVPEVPVKWNYEDSVQKVKQAIYKWKTLTIELAIELWIAREILSQKAAFQQRQSDGTFVPADKTWSDYCKEIGYFRRVVNRWLERWFEKKSLPKPETPELPEGIFNVIYADPPWQYDNAGLGGAAEKHYKTMALEEIKTFKDKKGRTIQDCCADNSIIYLWVTNPFLEDAFEILRAWGFDYKTNFCWVKEGRPTYGKLCFYIYGQHELLLLGTRGAFLPTGEKFNSIISSKKTIHSRKPEIIYDIIEKMYPDGKYLELFHRGIKRKGWECWGYESRNDRNE
jgi:N6-adenosine-specific RNA methylase IME4